MAFVSIPSYIEVPYLGCAIYPENTINTTCLSDKKCFSMKVESLTENPAQHKTARQFKVGKHWWAIVGRSKKKNISEHKNNIMWCFLLLLCTK